MYTWYICSYTNMSVYPSIHHCDQHISLQDFVERIVMQPWGRWYSHPLVQRNSMMVGMLILANVYEVNLWLWSFARGKPRLGGLSVEKTFERQVTANEASKERAAENRRCCKADKAWFKVKEVFDSICTQYILVYTRYIRSHPSHIPWYTHYSQVTV